MDKFYVCQVNASKISHTLYFMCITASTVIIVTVNYVLTLSYLVTRTLVLPSQWIGHLHDDPYQARPFSCR